MPSIQAAVSQIVSQYRQNLHDYGPMPYRAFAKELSEGLSETISFQAVWNWGSGVNMPDPSFLIAYLLPLDDWRSDFAQDILSVMRPDEYQPATKAGREVRDWDGRDAPAPNPKGQENGH